MKPEVRFVTRKWAPTVGGMETYCVRLCDELFDLCELDVIALPGRSKDQMPSIIALCLFGLFTGLKLLTRPAARVTHIGDVASWPFAWLAKKRNPSGRVVISAHGSDITYAARSGWRSRAYRGYLTLGACAIGNQLIISNSSWLASRARRYGFMNITVIPLGTEVQPTTAKGTSTHNGCILFAGRIVRSKGLSFLVEEVLPLLPKDMVVRVAGAVSDQSEAGVLQHSAIEYLGSLGAEELYDEYANAMCVVVPSQSDEGFGLVAAEAACAGGVVVASAHSGLLEVCSDGIGFLAEANVPGEWVALIQKICNWSAEERLANTRLSAAKACGKYNWTVVARDTFKAYEI